jgi:hypothetical protein
MRVYVDDLQRQETYIDTAYAERRYPKEKEY